MNSIEKLISEYLLKSILINIIYFTLACIIIIFTIIVTHHYINQKDRKIREINKEKFTELMIGYVIADEPVNLEDLHGHVEYQVFADVCIDILTNLSRSVIDKIHLVVEKLDVISYLVNMANSKSWVKQFYAIEKLGYLELDRLQGFFISFYNNTKKPELKIKTIISLSFIADFDSLKFITQRLSGELFLSAKLNEYIFTNVIKSLKIKKIVHKLPIYLNKIREDDLINIDLKKDLIHACAVSLVPETENAIIDYYYTYPQFLDMKIACIRALSSLKSKNCRDIIFAALKDEHWAVRAISVKAAVNYEQEAVPYLAKLLYDKNYNVRINTAKSLAKIGEEGILVLKQEIDSSDKYVRETVRFVLEIKDKLSYV